MVSYPFHFNTEITKAQIENEKNTNSNQQIKNNSCVYELFQNSCQKQHAINVILLFLPFNTDSWINLMARTDWTQSKWKNKIKTKNEMGSSVRIWQNAPHTERTWDRHIFHKFFVCLLCVYSAAIVIKMWALNLSDIWFSPLFFGRHSRDSTQFLKMPRSNTSIAIIRSYVACGSHKRERKTKKHENVSPVFILFVYISIPFTMFDELNEWGWRWWRWKWIQFDALKTITHLNISEHINAMELCVTSKWNVLKVHRVKVKKWYRKFSSDRLE